MSETYELGHHPRKAPSLPLWKSACEGVLGAGAEWTAPAPAPAARPETTLQTASLTCQEVPSSWEREEQLAGPETSPLQYPEGFVPERSTASSSWEAADPAWA